MIEAKDLRVGNCIEVFVKDEWLLNVVNADDIRECYYDNRFFNTFYHAIPLTPEILFKIGFVSYMHPNNSGAKVYRFNSFGIDFYDSRYSLMDYSNKIVIIKYLHQLQNIFFYLTGEELEYKQ